MKTALKLVLLGSLAGNAAFAISYLRQETGLSGGGARDSATAADTRGSRAGHGDSRATDTPARPAAPASTAKPASAAVVSVALEDLSHLLSFDMDHLTIDERLRDALDITPDACTRLRTRSGAWMTRLKQLEKDGLRQVKEKGENYYIVKVDEEDMGNLLDEMENEISTMQGIRDPALVTRIIASSRRFSEVRRPREFSFTRDADGNWNFTMDDVVMKMPDPSPFALVEPKKRYGHLFDFDKLATGKAPAEK